MRLYFARHGESQANRLKEISNRGLRHGLTPAGREQAQALAQFMKTRQITHLFTSPILRALETCIVTAHHLKLDYTVVDALREYDCGCMEGRSDEVAWQAWKTLLDAWLIDRRWDERIEGGESFHDIRARFKPFVDGLIQQYGETDAGILCIGHGGLYWTMLPLILENINTAYIRQTGFVYTSCITCEVHGGKLWCTDWNGQPVEQIPVSK